MIQRVEKENVTEKNIWKNNGCYFSKSDEKHHSQTFDIQTLSTNIEGRKKKTTYYIQGETNKLIHKLLLIKNHGWPKEKVIISLKCLWKK